MNKIKIGLVGLNFGYRFMKDELLPGGGAEPYFELGAVCDIDLEKSNSIAEELGVKAYCYIDDLINDPDVPAIALFIGPEGRAEIIDKIISAGKDVITTKPFEVNSQEALRVLKKAEKLGRIVHVNSPSPLPPADIQQIMKWQQEYDLGRMVACNWQTWCSYREKEDGSWYDDSEQCPVSPIFRLGIYAINDLLWLLDHPESVQVMHSRIFTGRPTPDNATMNLKFADGSLANIFVSFCVNGGNPYPDRMVINYENGTIYRNLDPMFKRHQDKTMLQLVKGAGDNMLQCSAAFSHDQVSGAYQWGNFHKAVNGQSLNVMITPEKVADGIRIIEAMKRAEKSGSIEEI